MKKNCDFSTWAFLLLCPARCYEMEMKEQEWYWELRSIYVAIIHFPLGAESCVYMSSEPTRNSSQIASRHRALRDGAIVLRAVTKLSRRHARMRQDPAGTHRKSPQDIKSRHWRDEFSLIGHLKLFRHDGQSVSIFFGYWRSGCLRDRGKVKETMPFEANKTMVLVT